MLEGLRVVVDVQHLFRPHKPNDRGSVFTLADGTRTTEGSAALLYAGVLAAWLEARGAKVVTNDPMRGILVGHYSTRNRSAHLLGAHAYLACHVNAGGGRYTLVEFMTMTRGRALADAIGPKIVDAFPQIATYQARALSTTDRGAVCIREVSAPCVAVIVEPFFGDAATHQSMLAGPELARLGTVIGAGVADWWRTREVPA